LFYACFGVRYLFGVSLFQVRARVGDEFALIGVEREDMDLVRDNRAFALDNEWDESKRKVLIRLFLGIARRAVAENNENMGRVVQMDRHIQTDRLHVLGETSKVGMEDK